MLKVTVEFFTRDNRTSPIEDFLDKCAAKQQVKILRLVQHLKEFGLTSAVPNTKKLKGTPLWELRILGRDNIRILFASTGKHRITILHIFFKKKQKTPRREIDIALKRYQRPMVDK